MTPETSTIVLIGGPNGAGKSTIAETVIGEYLGIAEFVNADVIARGLSGFDPDRAALQAGRVMLTRLRELAMARANFAFESTLASRSFAPWLKELVSSGYEVNLVYVWLGSGRLATSRVKARVRRGGHAVPEETVLRRYGRSVSNFFILYLPIATRWRVYDNSTERLHVVAYGSKNTGVCVKSTLVWKQMLEMARAEGTTNDR